MPTPEDVFGHRLRLLREQRGLSQSALAAALKERGLSAYASTIAKMEAREVSRPRVIRLNEACAVADVLGVSISDMLDPEPADEFISWLRARELSTEIGQMRAILDSKQREFNQLHSAVSQFIGSVAEGPTVEEGVRDGEHRQES